MFENEKELKELALSLLTEKRYKHTQGVRETARLMCKRFGGKYEMSANSTASGRADKAPDEVMPLSEKADLAVCFHDIFRGRPVSELDELADRYGIPERYKGDPNLAHGKLAAAAMKDDYGIEDEDVINAVSYHTTGRENMTLLEKIVFLADAIEPDRDYPGVERLRQLAETDLDAACLASLEGTIGFLESAGMRESEIDPDTILARDWLRAHCNK